MERTGWIFMTCKTIHQMWSDDNIPPKLVDWRATWIDHHRDWNHVFWTDESIEKLIEEKFPELMGLYLRYECNISRSDMSRYLILYEYGGLYCDLDIECFKDVSHLLTDEVVLFEEHPGHGLGGWPHDKPLLTNSIFYSVPGSKFMNYCIRGLQFALDSRDSEADKHHQVMMTTAGGYMTVCHNKFSSICNTTTHDYQSFESLSKTERYKIQESNMNIPLTGAGMHWNIGSWIEDDTYRFKLKI